MILTDFPRDLFMSGDVAARYPVLHATHRRQKCIVLYQLSIPLSVSLQKIGFYSRFFFGNREQNQKKI